MTEQLECKHNFQFLRQDKDNVGYDRNPTWLISDVYFCTKCLFYKRKPIEKQVPKSGEAGHYTEKLV